MNPSEIEFSPVLLTIKGPEFLGLYFGWFVLTFSTVLLLRKKLADSPLVTVGGLLAFELLG
ncbi:MAG TPA: hypothetical protein VGR78_03160, partial [Verrucomicrobiae bacterium]|nr:hypothetical protein [Verrucomicrobiae bacterium]